MNHIHLQEVDSTNTWLAKHASELPSMTLVTASLQTAGRGQRGNSWESQEGKNITLSLLWKPKDFSAIRQFSISAQVSLAVCDLLNSYGIDNVRIKWPNDIYVDDRKIAGILIEHSIVGRNIQHTIIGIGLNVNQTVFHSDAPNPVSMAQILNLTLYPKIVLSNLYHCIKSQLNILETDTSHINALHRMILQPYINYLWRGDGRLYPFATPDGERFDAKIEGVDLTGMLYLTTASGEFRKFAFKEVTFLLT